MGYSYSVPGLISVIAQDGPMTCWATVYTMMISWRRGFQMPIRTAVEQVSPRFATYYDNGLRSSRNPRGLPSAEFGPFLRAANMNHQPMQSLPLNDWIGLLKDRGLIWVGTLNEISPSAGLHSRIISAISGEGNYNDTFFSIIDPDGGRTYTESFETFIAKYEGALAQTEGQYLQIRHF